MEYINSYETMEPFPTTKWVMTWTCMYPPSEPSSIWQKIAYKVSGVILFGVNVFAVAVCAAFIWKFITINLAEALFTFVGIVAFIASFYCMLIAYFLRHRVRNIFVQLSTIYEASTYLI